MAKLRTSGTIHASEVQAEFTFDLLVQRHTVEVAVRSFEKDEFDADLYAVHGDRRRLLTKRSTLDRLLPMAEDRAEDEANAYGDSFRYAADERF